MKPRIFFVTILLLSYASVYAQGKFTIKENLRSGWLAFKDGSYKPLPEIPFTDVHTVYFELKGDAQPGAYLRLNSARPFFVFINGKVTGEYEGNAEFNLDSLSRRVDSPAWVAIHQDNINDRDFDTQIILRKAPIVIRSAAGMKPHSDFRDFVVLSGLIIIVLFLITLRLNPKLASDYFSVTRIFSTRESEDSQSSARLTSSSNVQFYVLCSLLLGFYLMIILRHLPPQYALPIRFQASTFWMMCWQWLKLSTIIFYVFLLKIVIIFSLTRLFGMRGMARFHFFNWIRLLLIVFGTATIVLFLYFISRGDSSAFFVVFLSLFIIALIGWVVVAFFKLSRRSEHSMFHLFSYICATEIIPLLITVKVLFQ